MFELNAVNDKIIVEDITVKEVRTESGLYMPETAVDNNLPNVECRVLSVGNECTDEIEVGDIVLTHPRSGQDITVKGKPYRVFNHSEIYCVLKTKN